MAKSKTSKAAAGDASVSARVITAHDRPHSELFPSLEDSQGTFGRAGALPAPYDAQDLITIYERSAALRPNVEAYATNIESFGFHLEPTVDLKANDAAKVIRAALIAEHEFDGITAPVSADEIAARRATIEAQSEMEYQRVLNFFEYCSPDGSFVEMRERTRIDYEVTGNGYWEVVRNKGGGPALLVHSPAVNTRLMPMGVDQVDVEEQQKISATAYRTMKFKKRFRRFVQIIDGLETTYFKELGDPRVMSADTGRFFRSEAELNAQESKDGRPARRATEMVHFRCYWLSSAYGVPRWVGALPAVLGSRFADEVNVLYFDNKAIPPMAILVSGGVLAKDAVAKIRAYLRDHIKGRQNFHSVIVLEAKSASANGDAPTDGRVRIELKPLMDAQQQDSLFQKYDERNTEKVGNQFRLPKLLRGDVQDFNRATAESAIQYAEQQVFAPERNKIDHFINRRLLPLLGVSFWRFVSDGPVSTDPNSVVDMLVKTKDAITPNEVRDIVGPLLKKPLAMLDEPWSKKPLQAYIADKATGGLSGDGKPETVDQVVNSLAAYRDRFRQTADAEVAASMEEGLDGKAREVERIEVEPKEFGTWVEPHATAQ